MTNDQLGKHALQGTKDWDWLPEVCWLDSLLYVRVSRSLRTSLHGPLRNSLYEALVLDAWTAP